MSRFDPIDLSQVPMPASVQVLDFDTAYASWMADFRAAAATYNVSYNVDTLRSDPAGWAMRVGAQRADVNLRGTINDAIKAVLVPTAVGSDLDNVVADFDLQRRILDTTKYLPGLPVEQQPDGAMELDKDLRARRLLAPEALTTAGSYGAYTFHSFEASADVLDVGVYGPEYDFVDDGKVLLVLLSKTGNGACPQQTLADIAARFFAWECPDIVGYAQPTQDQLDNNAITPDTDWVIVKSATIVEYTIEAVLKVRRGPDPETVRQEAVSRVSAYVSVQHRVGVVHGLDGIIAAGRLLNEDGTSPATGFSVTLPAADVDPTLQGAAFCTAVNITVEVDDG